MKGRIDLISEAVAIIATAVQPDQILQIISLILTCISVTISIIFTFYKWYKAIKNNKEIDENEVDELIHKIDELNNNIKGENK